MPQAAERRDNCHMQSLRGCVFARVCVCVCINHSTPVLCYYLGEQGTSLRLLPDRQAVNKPAHRRD